MAEYIKEKWSADFPDRAGQEVRPTEAVENTLDYDVLFPQYLSEDPVVFNQQNRTVSQLVSNDARLYERISATAADINAHLTDAKAHASGISGNAASASKLQTGRKIHRVLFDGTRDITLPDFSGCGEKTAGQSGMVPSPAAGKLNTVLHSNGSWGKVTYADMDEEAVTEKEQMSELKRFYIEKFEGNVLREFYPEGALKSEAEVKEGKRHGRYREYHENGKLKLRGKYSNNQPKGTWKYYTEEGEFERKEKF